MVSNCDSGEIPINVPCYSFVEERVSSSTGNDCQGRVVANYSIEAVVVDVEWFGFSGLCCQTWWYENLYDLQLCDPLEGVLSAHGADVGLRVWKYSLQYIELCLIYNLSLLWYGLCCHQCSEEQGRNIGLEHHGVCLVLTRLT